MDAKEPRSAMFAEKKAHLQALEITLRPNIWKEYVFHVTFVATHFLHGKAYVFIKVDSTNKYTIQGT